MKSKFTKFKQSALAMAFLFFSGMVFGQDVTLTQSFTSNGSWTVPAGVTEITIECIGGGGAGGYVHGSGFYFEASAGGGGGAYAKKVVSVSGGQTVNVVVGAGGYAWATSGNQVDGGDSYATVGGTIVVRAAGGKTVKGENTTSGAAGGAYTNCIGDTKYSGGNGGGSETHKLGLQEPGGGGGAAGSTGSGYNGGKGSAGAERPNYGGKGGEPKAVIGKGRTGGNYGGGGSGAECTGWGGEYGGDGASGYVIITYIAPPELKVDDMTDEICSGSTFSITPTGIIPAGTTYSWSAPSVTGITGTAAGSGASLVSGTLTNTTVNDINVVYNVTATDGSNTDDFTVTVTVKGIITPGSITANIISCNAGDTSKIFSSATDATGNGKYLWMKSTDNTTWTAIENATSSTYTPIYMGNTGLTYYKRTFYSDCESVESNVLTLQYPGTVNPGQVKSADPKKYCYGSAVTATLDTSAVFVQSGASVTFQWQESTDGGATWTDISGATAHDYTVNITSLTSDISYRYTIRLAGCDSIPANQWNFSTYALPVINSLTPHDTCPGVTEYYITADITIGDGAITTYYWDGSSTGSPYDTDTITASNCGEIYDYSLIVEDVNGCKSESKSGSFTSPVEPTPTFITETMGDFKSSTCEYTIPDLQDTLEKAFKHDCNFIKSYSQNPTAGTAMANNATVPVTATIETYCGNTYTPSVNVKSDIPGITAADIEFDDKNDTITLYYGICDTLYYVKTPDYDVTSSSLYAKSDLTLTNDAPYGGTVNEGTILGRISGGEYTITWKLTSPCGNYIEFPKKYVVMYPPCGNGITVTDADGNTYETVRIGCECWTKPNLKTKTGVKDTSYVYQNDPVNEDKFGRLYTWYSAVGITKDGSAADIDTTTDPKSGIKYIQGICPTGWAIPTAAAYSNMVAAAGGVNNIKSSDATTWLSGHAGTDAAGFTAVGAGYHVDHDYYFYDLLGETFFWTCEGDPITKKGTCCSITHICPELLIKTVETGMANSIRCVKRDNK